MSPGSGTPNASWKRLGKSTISEAKPIDTAIHYLIQTHGHHYRKHSVASMQWMMKDFEIEPIRGQRKTLPGVQVWQNNDKDGAAILFLRGTKANSAPDQATADERFAHSLTFALNPKRGSSAAPATAQEIFDDLLDLCQNVETGGLPLEILVKVETYDLYKPYPTDDQTLKDVFDIGVQGGYIVDCGDEEVNPENPPWPDGPYHRWLLVPNP